MDWQLAIVSAEKQCPEQKLQVRLLDKEQKIEILDMEKQIITEDLKNRDAELRHKMNLYRNNTLRKKQLLEKLRQGMVKIKEQNCKFDQRLKKLQDKAAKLPNLMTELYSHDNELEIIHETSSLQLTNLIRELNEIGVKVNFTNDIVRLDYINGDESVDVKTLSECIQRLMNQRNDLEKEVDYLKWQTLVSKPDIAAEIDGCGNETERARNYCKLLRTQLKDSIKSVKEILKYNDRADTIGSKHQKMVLDDFVRALERLNVQVDLIRIEEFRRHMAVCEASNSSEASSSELAMFCVLDNDGPYARATLQEYQPYIRFGKEENFETDE